MSPERRAARRLVFEIGTEELPPQAAWDGARQLREAAESEFRTARLETGDLRAFSTPRRLVLIAEGVAPRQADLIREVRGPAVKVAFTPEGRPSPAAEGFARAQGVAAASLERRTTPQGEYVYAVRRDAGAPTLTVLADLLPKLAGGLAFSKPMRWGTAPVRFVRPVRWLVALLGRQIVPCEFAGVRAGRRTRGHRSLHPTTISIADAAAYDGALRSGSVLLDPAERRERIVDSARNEGAAVGGHPVLDEDLLHETVQLVELPTVFAGRFADEFLALPREVLITVMQHHQKYFAVEDAHHNLIPAFLAVRNGDVRGLAIVREGNEWVLRARLADARFFFEDDRKRSLAARVPNLADLVFLEKLGTMREKTQRLEGLARALGPRVGLDGAAVEVLARAAHLSKADLVTQMVRELPELQGIIGGIYARLDGEPHGVPEAIRDQYLPRGAELPRTAAGAVARAVGQARHARGGALGRHRADRVPGSIRTSARRERDRRDRAGSEYPPEPGGHVPRRPRAVSHHGRGADPGGAGDPGLPPAAPADGADRRGDRLRRRRCGAGSRRRRAGGRAHVRPARLRRRGGAGPGALGVSVAPRVRAASTRRSTGRRASCRKVSPRRRSRELIREPAEQALRDFVTEIGPRLAAIWRGDGDAARSAADAAALAQRYEKTLALLSAAGPVVDRYFTDLLIMAPDPSERQNRLAQLAEVVNLVRPYADLSRVVVAEGKPGTSS